MTGLVPSLHFDGTAGAALTFYREIFGGLTRTGTFPAPSSSL